MKKIILFAIFLICACVVNAQSPTGVPQLFNGKWYKFNQFVGIDSALLVGSKDTNWIPRQPSLVFWQNSSSDTAFWYYNGRKWNKMGNFLDTSSLSNRINLRVKYSDTASMLSPYLRKLDTTSLSNRINLKADKITTLTINGVTYNLSANRTWTIPGTDTTSLSNRINLKLNISDTAAMLSPYQIAINARVKYTDTAAMLSPYLRKLDTASLSNRINLKADKATTLTINGTTYDLSANRSWTIPTVDTTSLSNRINLKLNISDTAAMLSPYQIAINARVKYTDTASMLSPYLRKLDTASLSNRINLKQNILSLTTTGTSGAATLVGATLNIPQYQSVLTNPITGTGTINTVAKFTSSSAIGNSNIKDDGNAVTVNTTAGSFGALQVGSYNGNILMNTTNSAAGLIFQNTSSSNKLWDISSYNNDLNFNESNIAPPVMVLKPGGNVLFGTTSNDPSGGKIQVSGTVQQSVTSAMLKASSTGVITAATVGTDYGTVNSVGLSMPSAFTVSNSPVTTSGTLTVAGAGTSAQYIRGDGVLATYNPGSGGGGSSQVYYFNGGVASGVGGYQEMSKVANTGASADFSINANGYIASFLTGAGVPNQVSIPAGNWNFEIYMSASSGGGSPSFYVELYKYDGTTFTLISSSSANPEYITNGTSVDLYVTALSVPATTLLSTDRLAVRVYVTHASKTIIMHTQNGNLSEVITTFTTGLGSLNGLIANTQYLSTGTSGSDFNISSITDTHTFNLPTASSTKRGALSSADWSTFNGKMNYSDTASLSNRINTKLNISDTASMLSNYLPLNLRTTTTTVNLNNKYFTINGLNPAGAYTSGRMDVAQNFSGLGYQKLGTLYGLTIDTLGSGTFYSHTSKPINYVSDYSANFTSNSLITKAYVDASSGAKLNISDTASMLSPYLRKADTSSLSNRINAKGNGTVTSIATNLGLTGGTITTTGTLSVDTASASILSRQRAANTYQAAGTYVTSVTGTSPIVSSGGTTPAISIPAATSSVNGYLSSTDWSTFNGKQNAINGTGFVKASGTTISYDNSTYYLASNPNGYTSNTGTVTSVATGLGLSGGTITTSGTLLVDTSSASILSRQRAANTYATTSALSGYLPLTGGTLTGALGGTTASFSSTISAASTITNQTSGGDAILYAKNGTVTSMLIANTTSELVGITGTESNHPFIIRTNNTERLRLASTGAATFSSSVGINGVFAGANGEKLKVAGSVYIDAAESNTIFTSGAFLISPGTYNNFRQTTSHDLVIDTYNGGTIITPFVLKQNGNIGIGTASPLSKLNVETSIAADGIYLSRSTTNKQAIFISADDNVGAYIAGNTKPDGTAAQTDGSGRLILQGGSTEGFQFQTSYVSGGVAQSWNTKMFIKNNGNVLIGTTTDGGEKLQVLGSARISGNGTYTEFSLKDGTASGSTWFLLSGFPALGDFTIREAGVANHLVIKKTTGAITLLNLAGTGSRAVLADANGLLSAPVSDSSVKENIKTLDYGINDIMKLKPVSFEYKKSYKNFGEGKQIGNIAQDVAKVIPEAVFTTPSTGKMGINYDQLQGVYIKALQELQLQNEALIKRIETLENK